MIVLSSSKPHHTHTMSPLYLSEPHQTPYHEGQSHYVTTCFGTTSICSGCGLQDIRHTDHSFYEGSVYNKAELPCEPTIDSMVKAFKCEVDLMFAEVKAKERKSRYGNYHWGVEND